MMGLGLDPLAGRHHPLDTHVRPTGHEIDDGVLLDGAVASMTPLLLGGAYGGDVLDLTSPDVVVRAAFARQWGLVSNALAAGFDVNARDSEGCATLHWVAMHAHMPTLVALLARGADPNLPMANGLTSVMRAACGGTADSLQVGCVGGPFIFFCVAWFAKIYPLFGDPKPHARSPGDVGVPRGLAHPALTQPRTVTIFVAACGGGAPVGLLGGAW